MNNIRQASNNSFKAEDFLQVSQSYTALPILFYIIQVNDISRSRLNQLDDWNQYEDPNNVSVDRVSKFNNRKNQGNTIIREVDVDSYNEENPQSKTSGNLYKLTLRDNFNNYCFAYEYNDRLPFLHQTASTGTPLSIALGGRLLINKGTLIMNGTLMLNRAQCQYLGIDEADKSVAEKLNSGIVRKYIELLNSELRSSS